MPKNLEYDAEAFATTLSARAQEVNRAALRLTDFEVALSDPQSNYYSYNTDHADEILKNLSKELHAAAERLNRLRMYTNYGPTREQLAAGE